MIQAKKFRDCKKLNKTYKGGVAKKGVRFNKVGGKHMKFGTRPKFSNSLYSHNKGLDRDNDGIACER